MGIDKMVRVLPFPEGTSLPWSYFIFPFSVTLYKLMKTAAFPFFPHPFSPNSFGFAHDNGVVSPSVFYFFQPKTPPSYPLYTEVENVANQSFDVILPPENVSKIAQFCVVCAILSAFLIKKFAHPK